MEVRTLPYNNYTTQNQEVSRSLYRGSFPVKINENTTVYEKLAAEGAENLYNYVEWLGLASDPDLIILPSTHHYFYDTEDLKEVRTIINLRNLNNIKQIKDFFHTIYRLVPYKSYFIGSFIDRNYQNGFLSLSSATSENGTEYYEQIENGITSRIPFVNMMYNLMDSRTNRYMTKRTVSLMLGDAGLKVLDMTELNGLTYFCTQKVRKSQE